MAFQLTLLDIVQTACMEMGLQVPSVVVGATDLQTQQINALANREVRELQQAYDWTALQTEYDLHVGVPVATTGDVTLNSRVIANIPDTSNLAAALFVVNGQFLPVDTRIVTVDSPTQVSVSQPATGTQAGVALVFSQDTYPEPPDFDRFINQTWWDRTNRWALLGPDSPQIDQWHRSGIVTTGPRRHFRQIGALGAIGGAGFSSGFSSGFDSATRAFLQNYRLWPPPGTLDSPIDLAFEYISRYSVWSVDGQGFNTFQADSDFTILDGNMVILGVKWRFFDIKGWDYAPKQQEYLDYVNRAYANDGGARTLNMARSRVGFLISPANVPDGFWPSGSSS